MVTKRRRRESGIFVPAPFVLINMGEGEEEKRALV
jgi:hypothetical protein